MTLSPRAALVMVTAQSIAEKMTSGVVTTDVMLIAMLRVGKGVGFEVLNKHGITEQEIIKHINFDTTILTPKP